MPATIAATPSTTSMPLPATSTEPAASRAAQTGSDRTKFDKGDLISDYFNAMAKRFGVMVVVQPEASKATVDSPVELPDKLNDAVSIVQPGLADQGVSLDWSVVGGVAVLNVSAKEMSAPAAPTGPREIFGIGPVSTPSPARVQPARPAAGTGARRGG